MDIDECTTRPRDDEGVPGEASTVAIVTEESVTPKATRPSVLDHSQYDISEARVGDLVARVFRQPFVRGSAYRNWWYEIEWRGQHIWSEIVSDTRAPRAEVEEMAVHDAQRLAYVVQGIGNVLSEEARAVTRDRLDRTAPTWVALPDEIEESAQ